MSLHCLFASIDAPAARDLLRVAAAGDAVLFLGAATRVAQAGHPALGDWVATGADLYALEEDATLYGVTQSAAQVAMASHGDFLRLAIEQERQLAWR